MVRLATADDAADVARLMIGFRNWWQREEPDDAAFEAGVGRLLSDPNTEFLLGGEPAGFALWFYTFSTFEGRHGLWLEDLFVEEGARGSGLGRALAEAALARARERGCARLELDVNAANPAALALYESLGFESWSDPPGGRNLLMRRRL